MKFDLSRDIAHIAEEWNQVCFDKDNPHMDEFIIYGPKGSGKTKAAQELARSHAGVFYFSFSKLTYSEAVQSFIRAYLPERADVATITDAVDAFVKMRSGKHSLVILEDETNEAMHECGLRFGHFCHGKHTLVMCNICKDERNIYHSVRIWHRSIAEFIKLFQEYDKNDAVRLHALTGGMMAVAKDLDEKVSYEGNVRRLLEPDSSFSTVLPAMLNECFRTPESYYPILKSMADGHCRLSEIAKDVGFPNNKCLKYIEALMENGFAVAEKLEGSKQSTYHPANTYFAAWCRYVYGRQMMQAVSPDALFKYVKEDMDERLTLPDFYTACMRFMQYAFKHYNNEYQWGDVKETKKAISVKLRDGSTVIIDYCMNTADEFSYNLIFPHSLDIKYTKDEMDRIYEALDKIDSRYYAHTVVFSFTRFSDWCTHENAHNEWFHIVPVERLKY